MKDVASCDKLRLGAHTRYYPQISEWGNPLGVMPKHPPLNKIGGVGATRGTETSKYPEEEKEKSISGVAASGTERAQTGMRAFRGKDCRKQAEGQENGFGKAGRRG